MKQYFPFNLRCVTLVLLTLSAQQGVAATPINIAAKTLPASIPTNGTVNASYTVTNQDTAEGDKTLVMRCLKGVTQVTTSNNACGNPIVLGKGASCTLYLSINGRTVNNPIPNESPQLCIKDTNQCYTPAADGQLNTIPRSNNHTQRVYLSNIAIEDNNGNEIGGQNSILVCDVSAQHTLVNCTSTGSGFAEPTKLAANPSLSYAYTGNEADNNNTVSQCTIGTNGALTNCKNLSNNLINTPRSVVVSNSYGYVSNYTNLDESLSYCSINANTGALTDCQKVNNVTFSPFNMALNSTFTRAYLANNLNNNINVCNINANGNLSNCVAQEIVNNGSPTDIALTNNQDYVYIANAGNNSVSVCPINASTGRLVTANCQNVGGFSIPYSIAIDQNTTYALIANHNNNKILYCEINSTTKLLENCVTALDYLNNTEPQVAIF